MFGVGISLGFSSAYVAVTPIASAAVNGVEASITTPSIKIVANSAGHRNTPPCCAFTDSTEKLFGDTAHHNYARQPANVIPSVFTYAAVENAILSAKTEDAKAEAEKLHEVSDRASAVKYKGHLQFTTAEDGTLGFEHDYEDNGNALHRVFSATSLFVKFLNHIKEHSVDGPCRLNISDSGASKEKPIFLSIAAPRYAFPVDSANADSSPWEWVIKAVMDSEFSSVVANVNFLFSDEAALLGADAMMSGNSSNAEERPFLMPRSPAASPDVAPSAPSKELREDVLVVDWGAQGLNLTVLRTVDGMLVGSPDENHFFSTLRSEPLQVCGGDGLDVALADRVALAFMLLQRRMFSTRVPQFMSAVQPRREVLGKVNPVVAEHIPARAMRMLRLKIEEKKKSLLSNQQVLAVPVEVEAFYEGLDLLDNQTISRRKLETGLISEWGLLESFQKSLETLLERLSEASNSRTATDAGLSPASTSTIRRVVLCGGMCQIPFFTAALEKVIRQVFANDIKKRIQVPVQDGAAVQVLPLWRLNGSVSTDEIFALGGCLQSYYSGMIRAGVNGTKKPGSPTARKTGSDSKRKGKELAAKARDDSFSTCWGLVVEMGKKTVAAASSHPVKYLARAIYLYTDSDMSAFTQQGNEGQQQVPALPIPTSALTTLFMKHTTLPSRVCIEWPEDQEDVVLFFLTDSIVQAEAEGNAASASSRLCAALSANGITLARPQKRAERKVFIVITVELQSEKPVLCVRLVAVRGDHMPTTLSPNSTESTTVIPLPCE